MTGKTDEDDAILQRIFTVKYLQKEYNAAFSLGLKAAMAILACYCKVKICYTKAVGYFRDHFTGHTYLGTSILLFRAGYFS